jgi:crotonobetainyl-CoA:carnitine CoA-transferase CaiB-like acyl-CoA transferase
MTMPLDGVVVADFSRVLAGPLASTMLADLGATVVKVERRGVGDDTRTWGPPWTATTSSYFECANRSKQSVELDLDDPEDLALARALAGRSDVVLENFREGTLARRSLDHESVARTNPGVVYCSVTGFGSRGGASLAGYDFLVQAMAGLMSITGSPDDEPMKVGVALVDVLTAKDAVIGILAALRERESSGLGQRVEVNLLSSLLGSMANQTSAFLATGRPPTRMGNRHPSIAPYETLRCADERLAVCCGNDGQFRRLAQVVGLPGLADDERFRTNPARVAHRDELVAVLEGRLGTGTARHWAERLAAAGVPAGRVGDVSDGIALAESLDLEPTVSVGDDFTRQIRHPITYSRTPVQNYSPPPRLGEHSDGIRRWLAQETHA